MRIKKILAVLLVVVPFGLNANPLYSPTWGFSLDIPPDYETAGGDTRNRFSFATMDGAVLDIVVYGPQQGRPPLYGSVRELAADVQRRLGSQGETSFFEYMNREAAILELVFQNPPGAQGAEQSGWGLCLELDPAEPGGTAPLLVALAFGPLARQDLQILHLSVLDSFAPNQNSQRSPGPITSFSFPREAPIEIPVMGLSETARFYAEDEEANQYVIDREFNVLVRYAESDMWEDAWIRYYSAIYRDARSRLENAAFVIERKLNPRPADPQNNNAGDFAQKVLAWLQGFTYQRDFQGSDFVNLIAATRDGKGDCDTRAMLWALVLNHAHIPAAMMVSRDYSHAMGLADLPGEGARFGFFNKQWLVAETTVQVQLGLIGEDVSDPAKWIGIILE